MKTFKDKAYLPPVDKIRKDLGKFHEKSDRRVIVHTPKSNSGNKPMLSNPTHSKRNIGKGAYFILIMITVLIILFFFMIFSLIFMKQKEMKNPEI
jgi:hypothetical protein